MLQLTYSNRTEALVEALVARLDERRRVGNILEPTHLIVPNRNLERYLELELCQHLGVVGNLRFHRLERFVGRWLYRAGAGKLLDRRALERHVLHALLDEQLMEQDDVRALRRYVGRSDVRTAQLAMRVARLFEGYAYSRPEMLREWTANPGLPEGDPERWQRALWLHLRNKAEELPLAECLAQLPRPAEGAMPSEVHVFGLSYVARVFQWAFAELARWTDVRLYVLNPCREFWEDVPSTSEKRWAQRVAPDIELPDDDSSLLSWWGRPAREHVHLLNEITSADFVDAFEAPQRDSVLHALQLDVLERAPEPEAPEFRADGSVTWLACAGPRREVEVVADEIWSLVEADPTLRFNQIGVFVHPDARSAYLPHIHSVFQEAGSLPHHVVDLPLIQESAVADAALRLLELLGSEFRRPEVLMVLTHPALRVPDGVDRARWARLVDRLGIFHGIDRDDHAGTYIDRDVVNWDQGVKRLVLGAFTEAEVDGFLPEPAESDAASPVLAALVRSLLRDARFVRSERRTLDEWATFIDAVLRGYLRAEQPRAEAEMRRCLGVVNRLRARDSGERVSFGVALELVGDSLRALGGARGEYLADGVVVSALNPMRAIPFRVVFLLGMGEGRFPTQERRDPLDLRARKRVIGDVSPVERDKYVFLETLLCTRERFYCSWASRDALTGDSMQPSPVVQELDAMLRRAYVVNASALVRRFPLRRHEDTHARAFKELGRERAARRAGDWVRRELGRELGARDLRKLADVEHDRLRALLALPRFPTSVQSLPERKLRISAIQRFLESPLQGWARGVLGLVQAEDDEISMREDEPFAPSALDATIALRHSFVQALRERRGSTATYEELIAQLQTHGRWPLGALQDHRLDVDHRTLRGWERVFGAVVRPDASKPQRVRFGSSPDVDESDDVRDAISLKVELPSGVVDVELMGSTQVLIDETHASLMLVPRRAPVGIELQRQRAHYALRGFLDYVCLVASEGQARDRHRTLLLYGDDAAQDASTHFGPLDPERARLWLRTIVADLLTGPHAYFLPSDAVLREPGAWAALSGSRLVGHARVVRRQGGNWKFGPIPAPERYPIPPPDDALEMARRRFGLFFRLAGIE